MEVTIPDDSLAVGKTIAVLDLPRAAVLVSIQRGDEVIIPHGDTHLHAGDVVTTLCERETIPPIKHLLLDKSEQRENENIPPEQGND